MWRLRCSDSGRDSPSPMVRALSKDLFSLNNHVGRHTWEFDASAGSAADKEAVERARATFVKHRHTQQHSSDELLRMQYDAMRAARGRRGRASARWGDPRDFFFSRTLRVFE